MVKTSALLFGIIYVLLGIIGFFATGFVGPTGFFAANVGYAVAMVIVGAVLLFGAYASDSGRTVNLVMGIILVLAALLGFIMAASGGTMLGMLVNGADNWLNVIAGIILVGSYYYNTESADVRSRSQVLRSTH